MTLCLSFEVRLVIYLFLSTRFLTLTYILHYFISSRHTIAEYTKLWCIFKAVTVSAVASMSSLSFREFAVNTTYPEIGHEIFSTAILFMPPTLKKWGTYWFRLVPVCVCVCVCVCGKIADTYFWCALNYLPLSNYGPLTNKGMEFCKCRTRKVL